MRSLKRHHASSSPHAPNISSKVFLRSTKNGRIQKVVREQYLRKDIPCSSQLCSICPGTAATDTNGVVPPFILSRTPAKTPSFPQGHYIIPDTNVLLSGMDVFEDAFHDVIVLQTVLEELKARSLPLYNRLMALTKSEEKRFYLFFNEFRSETAVKRDEGETINDRNDRAVRRAADWYQSHLIRSEGHTPAIVILTDDQANQAKAKAEGLTVSSLRDYVSTLPSADRLLDMISDSPYTRSQGELFYPDYYSQSKLSTGLKTGTLHKGIFNVSPYNYLEGTVKVPAFDKPLLILGRENSNRCISGDSVVIEILPKDQWRASSDKVIEEDEVNKNESAETEESDVVVTESERKALQEDVKHAHTAADAKAQPTARVVGVVKRNWRQFVGTIDAASPGQMTVFLVPMDKKIPKIRIRTRQVEQLAGKRILATIDAWDRDSRYPTGHYIRVLGELETKEAETEALLLEWDVQYRPFPKAVLDCLPPEGHNWVVPKDTSSPLWAGRKDLRELLVCSIDPPNCQDIDDALHARPLPNGNFQVGVHIADVSHFVRPNNAMDTEAATRGTTVYLVDKRIDMLPPLLGTDLCSLKPDIERFAFSVLWELTPNADVISASFTKSVIYSRQAFSYEEAQKQIDSSATDELTTGMRTLLSLSQKLRAKRMAAGALNLSSPEVRIESSEDSDSLSDVKTKAHLATNSLVEEFMLLANISVAAKIAEMFPQTALLRRHATPPSSNFADLTQQLRVMRGFELDVSSSKTLAESLDQCVDPQHPFFNTLIRIMATRCMTSAEYFVSGTQAEPEYRHYGLASPIYTHFTSPIRRYADLLAHRQLGYAIGYSPPTGDGGESALRNKNKLEEVCRNLNFRHRNAQMAGRASIEYYVGQALKARGEAVMAKGGKGGEKHIDVDGYVMRVLENGIVVFVPQFGVEGLVRLDNFQLSGKGVGAQRGAAGGDEDDEEGGKRESEYDAEKYSLRVFEKGREEQGMSVELFQQLRVRVSSEEKSNKRDRGKRRVRIVVLGTK
jgi:exosome complex exonuclease DIS3/RRP44